MEMNNSGGGESHVAQHRRRDELRAHHHNSYDYNLEQLWLHQVHIPESDQLRNFKYGITSYDQTAFSSEMLNYVTRSSQGLSKQNESYSNSIISSYLSHLNSSSTDNYTGNPNAIINAGGETNDVNCAPSLYPKQPNCYGYQDVDHSSLGESSIINQTSHSHFGELQQQCNTITSPFDYQNALQQVVHGGELDLARYNAKDSGELLHFLPSFGDSNSLTDHTPVDQAFQQWNVEGLANKSVQDPQGLSLSLSVDFRESDDISDNRYLKALKYSNYLCSTSKQSSVGSKSGFGLGYGRRNIYNVAGAHGPFTGYASILKDSKYLKPTTELLEDLCGPKPKISAIYPDDIDQEEDFCGSSVSESSWPAYHKKMASLLYLQQEVCRIYKQYQQQMQMVVSSFESVEGVSTATPYISMALKTISMHFRCLKDAISDQLKHTGKELGEELSSQTAGTSSSAKFGGDARNFQKQKSSAISLEPKQPVWKPQRGLPDRAVSVLRAWLFDHFLHPYPTDTDKHMLAMQTGLTRNQVSNWFINARVRIWKPMVEEIHLLETKGMATDRGRENMGSGCGSHQYDYNQPANRPSAFTNNDGRREDLWNQEKRSRSECDIPVGIQGSLMSFLPYHQHQQDGFEIGGGHGNVSLTLGLRQNALSVQQQMHQHL